MLRNNRYVRSTIILAVALACTAIAYATVSGSLDTKAPPVSPSR
jgi:hypothetical protein